MEMENELASSAAIISDDVRGFLMDTYFVMPTWKWIALVAVIVIGWCIRPLIEWALRRIKRSTSAYKGGNTFLHFLFNQATEVNISWVLVCIFWLIGVDALQVPEKFDKYLTLLVHLILAIQIIRFLYRAVDAFGSVLRTMAARTDNPMDDQLAPFATKVLKFIVVVVGFLLALQNMGINVVSLLAGLGLGGLALALAAQDTAANLFGSIMILADSPFKIGDYIKVGDTEGIVEDIGFRSTKVRTFYNSVVTLPNSTVAKEKIDNMERRPQRRVKQVLGLAYETPVESIDQFCQSLKDIIAKTDKVAKDGITVAFNNFNTSSLDVVMQFHIQTSDYEVEVKVTQEIFKQVLELAKKLRVEFAYPTQTLYVKKDATNN